MAEYTSDSEYDDDDGDDFKPEVYKPYYVPPNVYRAKLKSWKKHDFKGDTGKKLIFQFELLAKKHNGELVPGMGDLQATPGNVTGRLISGMTGMQLSSKNMPGLNSLIGTEGWASIRDVKNKKGEKCTVWDFSLQKPGEEEDDDE